MDIFERALRWSADRFPFCKPLYYHNPGYISTAQAMAAEVLLPNTLTTGSHTRTLPVWASGSVISEYQQYREVRLNPKPLYLLKDVVTVGPPGFVKDKNGRFPLEQTWGSREILEGCLEYQKRNWGKPRVITEPVFHLGGHYVSNYFHWLHDVLARLFGVMPALPKEVRWLVPSPLLEFHAATLERLQIGKDRLIPIQEGSYQFRSLYYSPYWGGGPFDAPEVTRWLGEKMNGPARNGQLGQKKIYLSRQQASRRKIANQKEVEAFLFAQGFEEAFCERLNFAQQQAVFANAKIVCGVHGAGFANLYFCPPGSGCVEIHGAPVRDALQYWSIADSAGLKYAVVAGKRQGTGHNDDDLSVDVAELSKAIDTVLAS